MYKEKFLTEVISILKTKRENIGRLLCLSTPELENKRAKEKELSELIYDLTKLLGDYEKSKNVPTCPTNIFD